MLIQSAPLAATASALRTGQLDLLDEVERTCQRIDALDPQIQSLLLEPDRLGRLRQQAAVLQARYPDPESRPPLYGILVGVKDIYRADGFPTRAGSTLPPERLAGAQASCVTELLRQGSLILGKTVTAQFAYVDPGPTRNPHHLEHTPGGSSSGSAAAVAAGFCPLALGTQTIGSVIRPAAYCGIVGFKPSFGRIPTDGIIPVSPHLDHVGLFTQDVQGMALAASLLCQHWTPVPTDERLPVLGIPVGAYLEQASTEGLAAFESHVQRLEHAGYTVKRVPALRNISAINEQTGNLMAAGVAASHKALFAEFEDRYGPRIAWLVRKGQALTPAEYQSAEMMQQQVKTDLATLMTAAGIDLWISPATTGPAPQGLASTGDSAMNLPWTLAGLPTITLPAGKNAEGLPLGIQLSGRFMADESLLLWSQPLADRLH